MNKNHMKRLMVLFFCLCLLMPTMVSVAAIVEDQDGRDLGAFVILEDPDLIGDPEEWMYGVFDEVPEGEEATDHPDTTDPTGEPTLPPTDQPTTPPTADYVIEMESPNGWYANRAVMEMTVIDVGGTGWDSVKVTIARSGGTITLIDGPLPSGHIWIELLENCTVEAIVTDPNGEQHKKEVNVNCFDHDNPSLSASVKGEYLYIETSDRQSGVAAVQVNGTLYTELNDGKLEIWLKQYADAYEQLIVQAVDRVGNVSKAIAVANPFYQHTGTNTQAPAPTATPKPTKAPSGSGGNGNSNGNNNGNNNGSSSATPTPTVTPIATLLPEYILPTPTIDTGFPFYHPGNAMTRDLLYDRYTNKQFIAIETRNGDVFYIVIDYDKPLDDKGERYETYFLNLVDSRDMLDIVDEKDIREPEIVYVTPEPTEQPTPAPIIPVPEPEKSNNGGMLGIIGILAIAGGGAFWYFKIRKPSGGKAQPQYDDYDFDDDDDDMDEEMEIEDE